MDTAAEVLLIIVSSVLTIFLVILCVALIMVIKILRKANDVADTVESAATAVKNSATAMPFVRLLSNIISKSRGRK